MLQDRHALGQFEPEEDASQDYELLQGYENGTHTVLRFRRKYDTCDPHDFRITVSDVLYDLSLSLLHPVFLGGKKSDYCCVATVNFVSKKMLVWDTMTNK